MDSDTRLRFGADDEARNFCTSSSSLWEVSAQMCHTCMLKVICNIERLNENIYIYKLYIDETDIGAS